MQRNQVTDTCFNGNGDTTYIYDHFTILKFKLIKIEFSIGTGFLRCVLE